MTRTEHRPRASSLQRRTFLFASCVLLTAIAVFAASDETVALTRPEDVGVSAERLARVTAAMQRYVDAGNLPGVVTLVARRGKIVHFGAIGSRNVATGRR